MSAQEWLDRADALAAGATEGPWRALTTGTRGGDHWYVCDAGQSIALIHANDGEDEDSRQPDAEFIAASRTLVAAMSAALRAVLDLHRQSHVDGFFNRCVHDGERWPCPTVRGIDQVLS